LRAAAEEVSGGAAPSPEATVLSAERREELVSALTALREEDREVIGCRFLVGLSERETAAALGLRHGTVKSRTARALARLRDAVGEEGSP
jgi:RNA polymerase sigma-70 factor (ECF subfamily)